MGVRRCECGTSCRGGCWIGWVRAFAFFFKFVVAASTLSFIFLAFVLVVYIYFTFTSDFPSSFTSSISHALPSFFPASIVFSLALVDIRPPQASSSADADAAAPHRAPRANILHALRGAGAECACVSTSAPTSAPAAHVPPST
jgi:hypothetical protein